jgi:hypothetical protein
MQERFRYRKSVQHFLSVSRRLLKIFVMRLSRKSFLYSIAIGIGGMNADLFPAQPAVKFVLSALAVSVSETDFIDSGSSILGLTPIRIRGFHGQKVKKCTAEKNHICLKDVQAIGEAFIP